MYYLGEIVTPRDKSKLFSVMKTLQIAVLPKIYGPQIIPERQCAFPAEGFPLHDQPLSPCSCVLGASYAFLPEVSVRWGPGEAPAHSKHSTNVCLPVCLSRGSTRGQCGRVPFSRPCLPHKWDPSPRSMLTRRGGGTCTISLPYKKRFCLRTCLH